MCVSKPIITRPVFWSLPGVKVRTRPAANQSTQLKYKKFMHRLQTQYTFQPELAWYHETNRGALKTETF